MRSLKRRTRTRDRRTRDCGDREEKGRVQRYFCVFRISAVEITCKTACK